MLSFDGALPTIPEGRSVLVVMAHPDDAEFNCGGTIASWAAAGKVIDYVVCTSGDKGSGDPAVNPFELARTRRQEQVNAARVLGARDVTFLGYSDGVLQNTLDLRRDIVRQIRRLRPDAVICQDPTQRWGGTGYLNHPDHRAAGDACLDAVYPSARDPHVFPELLLEGLEPHKVREVFMATGGATADVWVDVTDYLDKKIEALRQHVSQTGHRAEQLEERIRERSRAARAPHANLGSRGDPASRALELPFEYAEGYKYFRLQG
jgi:LmbE family N-acetylglucosaminyl deacetylase